MLQEAPHTSSNTEAPGSFDDDIVSELYEKEFGFKDLVKQYHQHKDDPKKSAELRDQIESILVDSIVCDMLKETLVDELFEMDLDENSINELEQALHNYNLEDKKRILSFPKSTRYRIFHRYKHLIDRGPKIFLDQLLQIARKYKATIGYHLSNSDILPRLDGEWSVNGYELDDRDDRPMAYYSLDWYSRYKFKPARFLYLIRAFLTQERGHKLDTSNRWGRASTLSIIDKVDLEELEKIKQEKLRKILKDAQQ